MSEEHRCLGDDCKNLATQNELDGRLTRCDTHKLDDNTYNKTIEFIKKAKDKHGDTYGYWNVVYKNTKTKVDVFCYIHGLFSVRTDGHLSGYNCKKCAINKSKENLKAYHYKRKTQEQFINEIKNIHKDKYDYTKVIYLGDRTHIIIICPKHGEFKQSPNGHLRGHGCQKCQVELFIINRTFTKQKFIDKANKKHNNKYDYSKLEYTKSQDKVIIICPTHGEFTQCANNHLQGDGCKKCANENLTEKQRKTQDQFLEETYKVHGNTYDYSKTIYIKSHDKIIIICKIHGEFLQSPKDHLSGRGCNKCGIEKRASKQRFSTEAFIMRANEIHKNKYIYSKVEYIRSQSAVIIICPIHGEFKQCANSHLQGMGCNNCAIEKNSNGQKLTSEEVISRAKKIHGDKYDYSNINYINWNIPLNIKCNANFKNGKIHGIFKQLAGNHINHKQGCPKCSLNGFSKSQIEWIELLMNELNIYIININNDGEHRIQNTRKRADGYCKKINTIFEFHGCFYHGCINCYKNRNEYNKQCKKTYDELYNKTINKENICKENGYNYISIWNCEWERIKKDENIKRNYIENLKLILPNYIDNQEDIDISSIDDDIRDYNDDNDDE